MTALKFALGAVACALVPAAVLGALAGFVFDRIQARRDWQQQWDNLANEAASWLQAQETG